MSNRIRRPVVAALRLLAAVLATVAAATLAAGWLYWIRGGVALAGPWVATRCRWMNCLVTMASR